MSDPGLAQAGVRMDQDRDTTGGRRKVSSVGWMLRQWRSHRGMSQQTLAQDASVSTRHLSFVETGRAEPSRELLLKLSHALGMPPRDRNALLSSAGYQPIYREAPLHDPQMAELTHALALILRQHDPFAAVAMDRDSDVVMCNRGFASFMTLVGIPFALPPLTVLEPPRLNVVDSVFDPDLGFRGMIMNWEEVASEVLWRARAEVAATRDEHGKRMLERVLRFPGVAALEKRPPRPAGGFVVPLQMAVGELHLNLFTTITTLGTPQDLTACEVRIEAYHPADSATEALIRTLVPLDPPGPATV